MSNRSDYWWRTVKLSLLNEAGGNAADATLLLVELPAMSPFGNFGRYGGGKANFGFFSPVVSELRLRLRQCSRGSESQLRYVQLAEFNFRKVDPESFSSISSKPGSSKEKTWLMNFCVGYLCGYGCGNVD